MTQVKRWTEIESARIGLLITQALNNLKHGEDGEVDVEIGGNQIRIANDQINKRVVIFEVQFNGVNKNAMGEMDG